MNRHLKRWNASEAFFAHMFLHHGQRYFVVSDVPEGAKLVRVVPDMASASFWFFFQHESFPEVPECEVIPVGGQIVFLTDPKDFPNVIVDAQPVRFREFF